MSHEDQRYPFKTRAYAGPSVRPSTCGHQTSGSRQPSGTSHHRSPHASSRSPTFVANSTYKGTGKRSLRLAEAPRDGRESFGFTSFAPSKPPTKFDRSIEAGVEELRAKKTAQRAFEGAHTQEPTNYPSLPHPSLSARRSAAEYLPERSWGERSAYHESDNYTEAPRHCGPQAKMSRRSRTPEPILEEVFSEDEEEAARPQLLLSWPVPSPVASRRSGTRRDR